MSRDKKSRNNGARSRDTVAKARGLKIEKMEYECEIYEKEAEENEEKVLLAKNDRRSSSVGKEDRRSRRQSEPEVDGESIQEDGQGSDNLTYTKRGSSWERDKELTKSPIDSVRKVEDYLMREDKAESESVDEELMAREKRKKSRKQRKVREARAAEEDGRSSGRRGSAASPGSMDDEKGQGRKEKRRKSRKKGKDKSGSSGSKQRLEEHEEPRIPKRRKKRRSRLREESEEAAKVEEQEKELPITEILRKAQEDSRKNNEEPVPLIELTTDTVYVQGKNGFSAVKVTGRERRERSRSPSTGGLTLYPIKVAIAAQRLWSRTSLLHQGLLAGMAMMHIILMQKFFNASLDFLLDYSLVSEIYTDIFSFLVTMCVVSVLDKFDPAHLDVEHWRDIYVDHSRSFLAMPLYLATFCCHQATLLLDDRISLLGYTGNATLFENNSNATISEESIAVWEKMTLAKDSLAILAWLLVGLGPREDMLLSHLKTMEKYTDTPEASWREIDEELRRSQGK